MNKVKLTEEQARAVGAITALQILQLTISECDCPEKYKDDFVEIANEVDRLGKRMHDEYIEEVHE